MLQTRWESSLQFIKGRSLGAFLCIRTPNTGHWIPCFTPLQNLDQSVAFRATTLFTIGWRPIGVFTISISYRKADRRSARQKNSGKINLLKSCLQWDLISQQQPSLLWSLTPNHLGHWVLCWMRDLSNEFCSCTT